MATVMAAVDRSFWASALHGGGSMLHNVLSRFIGSDQSSFERMGISSGPDFFIPIDRVSVWVTIEDTITKSLSH